MSTARAERRTGWALPPQPPENWVGHRWAGAFVVALASAIAIPSLGLLSRPDRDVAALAALHVVGAAAALIAAYVLMIQETVTADARLRWMAGAYVAIWPVVLLRSAEVKGPDRMGDDVERGALLGLLWLVAVPAFALTAGLARRRGSSAVLAPLLLFVSVVVLAVALPGLPDLVAEDGTRSDTLRTLSFALAAVPLAASASWARSTRRGPWSWVTVGLLLTAAAAVVLGLAERRYDNTWWTGQLLQVAALAVPAAGLSLVSAAGYRRQSRRWRQLVTEVADLRAASPLLPGLSVSPEDDEGLPSQRQVRSLIDAGLVKVALQPVVRLDDAGVVGYEALSRFGGRVPTDRWFRAASHYGLGGELERLTLKAALALLPGLPDGVFLAVNVSPAALEDEGVLALLQGSDLERVVVEVTEHEAVGDYSGLRSSLKGLRRARARIAVDDTGAGFASLRHVLMLQPDVIKLDTSLSRSVHYDERQQKLVTALLTFAAEVGSIVLAEGIETEEQLEALRRLGVPVGQGWHLGVPTIAD